jgi:hypothetical protein
MSWNCDGGWLNQRSNQSHCRMMGSFPGILYHLQGLKNDLRAAENQHEQFANAEFILLIQNSLKIEGDWGSRTIAHRAD